MERQWTKRRRQSPTAATAAAGRAHGIGFTVARGTQSRGSQASAGCVAGGSGSAPQLLQRSRRQGPLPLSAARKPPPDLPPARPPGGRVAPRPRSAVVDPPPPARRALDEFLRHQPVRRGPEAWSPWNVATAARLRTLRAPRDRPQRVPLHQRGPPRGQPVSRRGAAGTAPASRRGRGSPSQRARPDAAAIQACVYIHASLASVYDNLPDPPRGRRPSPSRRWSGTTSSTYEPGATRRPDAPGLNGVPLPADIARCRIWPAGTSTPWPTTATRRRHHRLIDRRLVGGGDRPPGPARRRRHVARRSSSTPWASTYPSTRWPTSSPSTPGRGRHSFHSPDRFFVDPLDPAAQEQAIRREHGSSLRP